MIEDLLNTKLDPKTVFNLETITDKELIETAHKTGWINANQNHLNDSKNGLRTDLYVYYALYAGNKAGLKEIDLYSFAGLMSTLITGLGASFGTDYYEKEQIIENKALDLYSTLIIAELSPLQIAKALYKYCLNEYLKPDKIKMVSKNYTIREDQANFISEYAFKNKLNQSEALRQIIDNSTKKEKKKC